MIGLFPGSKNETVYVQIDNLAQITRRSIRHGFFMLGKDLRITANREILRRPKSGKTYIVRSRSGRRRRHVASAPGETHANLSGALRRSMGWKVRGHMTLEFGYGVDKPAPDYGEWIEFGSTRIRPRPSLLNAINATDRNAEKYFERSFQDEIT